MIRNILYVRTAVVETSGQSDEMIPTVLFLKRSWCIFWPVSNQTVPLFIWSCLKLGVCVFSICSGETRAELNSWLSFLLSVKCTGAPECLPSLYPFRHSRSVIVHLLAQLSSFQPEASALRRGGFQIERNLQSLSFLWCCLAAISKIHLSVAFHCCHCDPIMAHAGCMYLIQGSTWHSTVRSWIPLYRLKGLLRHVVDGNWWPEPQD